MKLRSVFFIVAVVSTLAAPSAHAVFDFMQIEQVVGGVDGDNTIQAIQLRMRSSFQNLVSLSRVVVWDAAGNNPIVVSAPGADVVNEGVGVRVLIASTNFISRTTPPAVPDFIMDNLIPASYLAAGSMTFEDSAGALIFWRLSWGGGGYTGSNFGFFTNDADGNFGPPFGGPLQSADTRAVQFQGAASALSTNNLADYALTTGDAVFVNNVDSTFTVETIATGIGPQPLDVTALHNYPNPFNPYTEIVFNMAWEGHASLQIFDGQGRQVTTLVNGNVPAGPNHVTWNGRDSRGTAMATGVYFYRLVTQDAALTRKMVLLK